MTDLDEVESAHLPCVDASGYALTRSRSSFPERRRRDWGGTDRAQAVRPSTGEGGVRRSKPAKGSR